MFLKFSVLIIRKNGIRVRELYMKDLHTKFQIDIFYF